jgi:hypothetical protein
MTTARATASAVADVFGGPSRQVMDAVQDAKDGGALKRLELEQLKTRQYRSVADQQQFLQDQLGEVPTTLTNRTAELEARVKEGTLDRMPQDRIEAILLGTNKFTDEGGIQRIIRRFHTEALPLGRTDQEILRRGHRGMTKRLEREKRLTPDGDQGFYTKTPVGSHAHHWNPLKLMDEVTAGLTDKQRNGFIKKVEKELGIYSGNHLANLRQLPDSIHTVLHQRLDKAFAAMTGKSLTNFKISFDPGKKGMDQRMDFMRQFKEVLEEEEGFIFSEMMKRAHPNSAWNTGVNAGP